MKKYITIALMLAFGIATLFAQTIDENAQQGTDNRGQAGFSFLKMAPTAKNIATAEAMVSGFDSAESMFYNFSETSEVEGISMFYANQSMYDNLLTLNTMALAFKISERFGLGFSVRHLTNTEDIEVTTIADPDGNDTSYSFQDLAIGAGLSYRATKRFSFGIKLKILSEIIHHVDSTAFVADVSSLYRLDFANSEITAMIENYGPDASFDGSGLRKIVDLTDDASADDEDIHINQDINRVVSLKTKEFAPPLRITLGYRFDIYGDNAIFEGSDAHKLTMLLKMDKSNNSFEAYSFGLTYRYNFSSFDVYASTGLKTYTESDYDSLYGVGAGVVFKASEGTKIGFDYAYKTHEDLDDTNVFSLVFNF